jgi:hypothetical protein
MTTTKTNGKKKGNGYERSVSNKFSERFASYTGIEKSFRRSVDSGSFFGGSNQKRTTQYDISKATFGDIITPDKFRFSIECKNYKTPPTFKSVLNKKVSQWDDWLDQAVQDAKNSNKEVLLIVKYNNVDEFVFVKDYPRARNHNVVMEYNGFNVVKLSDFLIMEDDWYFCV